MPMPTLPLFRIVMAVVPAESPTLKIKLGAVAVLEAAALLPSRVSVPSAEVEPINRGAVREVAEATPKTGVTKVGEVEKTILVVVVPVVPPAEVK